MLVVEDLLLLLTDGRTGRSRVDSTGLGLALAGAVVLELAERGRVDVSGPGEAVRPGRLVVRDLAPTDDPLLDGRLHLVAARRPAKPQDVLPRIAKGLRYEVLARLTAQGVLRLEEGHALGVFPTRRWHATDPTHEDRLRRGLADVLVVGRTPTEREVALISLLHAIDQVPKVLGVSGPLRREVKRRAKEIAAGEAAGVAVRKAVEQVNAAVVAAVVAAGAAGIASSGS